LEDGDHITVINSTTAGMAIVESIAQLSHKPIQICSLIRNQPLCIKFCLSWMATNAGQLTKLATITCFWKTTRELTTRTSMSTMRMENTLLLACMEMLLFMLLEIAIKMELSLKLIQQNSQVIGSKSRLLLMDNGLVRLVSLKLMAQRQLISREDFLLQEVILFSGVIMEVTTKLGLLLQLCHSSRGSKLASKVSKDSRLVNKVSKDNNQFRQTFLKRLQSLYRL